ncbi:MAG: TolC family protein [Bacillota bacterium]|jgi:outer membrane protein TolC|nr:TolC family protein [Bacillota bacterium]
MRKGITLFLILFFVLGLPLPKAFAEQENRALTLEDALNLALSNSKDLKKAQYEVKRTEALREKASEALSFIPAEGETYNPEIEVSWNRLLSADLNWQMSKKTLTSTTDALVLKVCKGYWDVQVAEMKLATMEKLTQQALINLQNTRNRLTYGAASPSSLSEAELQWKQAQSNEVTARHSLEDAYNAFNQLVGLGSNERPRLTDKPAYEPLEVANLDYEVQRVIEESPSAWLAQQKVTLAKWAADMIYFSGDYTPYEVRQTELDQAELDAAGAKELLANVTRSLYYQAKSLEEKYNTAQEALKAAQQKLRVAQVKFDIGMITRAELVAAEVEVTQAQDAVEEAVRNHTYLRMAFEKPWAASGGGA